MLREDAASLVTPAGFEHSSAARGIESRGVTGDPASARRISSAPVNAARRRSISGYTGRIEHSSAARGIESGGVTGDLRLRAGFSPLPSMLREDAASLVTPAGLNIRAPHVELSLAV